MKRFFISTIPFASTNQAPLDLLKKSNVSYEINSLGRKITEEELTNKIEDFDVLIAGTEPITENVLDRAKKLKVISRVGVGIDNIDLDYAQKKGIIVKISSHGPVNAVAEYTVGLILSMLRHIHLANHATKNKIWKKNIGKDLAGSTVGILGAGNIGKRVIDLLQAFSPKKIIFYDPYVSEDIENAFKVPLEEIITTSDILSLHLPLNSETQDLISINELNKMKKDSIIINTSRGGIVNEDDLYITLKKDLIAGAALDVFIKEPYTGKLTELDNCLVSPHMAPMTLKARESMEFDAITQALDALGVEY